MKILIIEDEPDLLESLHTYLGKGGFLCEKAVSVAEAMDKLSNFKYDIVLLDIMLPDGNGLEILDFLKQKEPDTGVLIISAKNALDDKITGLELGADDYLTKPFHLPELNARLKAIYRRRKFHGQKEIVFEKIRIDTETMETRVGEEQVVLTLKEYELLLFFIANKKRVLTKQSIAEHLWGDNVDFLDSFDFVYQHIKNLRKKLTAAGTPDYIKTIYGMGYKFTTD
jgi:DNA-binding response OmpR family regulator